MNLDALTPDDIKAAARRVHEESQTLLSLFALQRDRQRVYWVLDANIAHLYFDPHHHADYASPVYVASARGKKAESSGPAETALAWVLADFIFGERFALNQPPNRGVDPAVLDQRIILEPHATELHEAFAAIRRKSLSHAGGAVNAVANTGPFRSKLKKIIEAFKSHPQQDARLYVRDVQGLIRHHLQMLLPDGATAELGRAGEMLKRDSVLYEADVPWLAEELASEAATDRIFELTDFWYGRLMDLRRADDTNLSPEAELERRRHGQNDAIALAKLQYLNESRGKDMLPRRFVFISAHGLIHRAVRESRVDSVSVLRPSVFLGSKFLFPIQDTGGGDGEQTGRWVRLTNSLELLHESGNRHWPSEGNRATGEDSQSLVRFKRDWNELLDFALPFLPAHASNDKVQELAQDLLKGSSLRAFERTLYSALGDLLVLSSEMSLDDGSGASESPMAPAPILRLAFYPSAEDCILALALNEEGPLDARTLIDQVRQEQEQSSVVDFNYSLLICLACWFVSLGRIRPARALVGHARAVVEVTTQAAPLVTGREAAFFEGYLRRLQVRDLEDINQAETALRFFREAIGKEEMQWESRSAVPSAAVKGTPREEFFIHRWRARLLDLSIELLRITLPQFTGSLQSNSSVAAGLRPLSRRFNEILNSLLEEIRREDIATYIEGKDLRILHALRDFSVCDALITACRCMLLIAASNPGRGKLGYLSPTFEVLSATNDALPPSLSRFGALYIELVACIWGKQNGQSAILREGLDTASNDTDPVARLRRFLRWVAAKTDLVED